MDLSLILNRLSVLEARVAALENPEPQRDDDQESTTSADATKAREAAEAVNPFLQRHPRAAQKQPDALELKPKPQSQPPSMPSPQSVRPVTRSTETVDAQQQPGSVMQPEPPQIVNPTPTNQQQPGSVMQPEPPQIVNPTPTNQQQPSVTEQIQRLRENLNRTVPEKATKADVDSAKQAMSSEQPKYVPIPDENRIVPMAEEAGEAESRSQADPSVAQQAPSTQEQIRQLRENLNKNPDPAQASVEPAPRQVNEANQSWPPKPMYRQNVHPVPTHGPVGQKPAGGVERGDPAPSVQEQIQRMREGLNDRPDPALQPERDPHLVDVPGQDAPQYVFDADTPDRDMQIAKQNVVKQAWAATMAERQRRVQENAVERQTERRNRIQQGRDGLSADERTPEEKFKEAQEIAKSRRRVLGLENNRREQDEVFGGTAWEIAQAAAGHEMDEDKKQLQVVIAKEQPEDDLTPGGEPDIPRQVQRQGERQRMPPEPDAAKRKQNVQQNARQREDERRKRLGKEPREDEPEVDVPFEDKLEDRRDRVQDRAIERNQERKDRLQQRRGHMAIEAARTQDGLANMAMNEALEGPNEFVAPRAHEAVQTRPGRETDGLPHETFGKTVVDATKASTRAMERLSGELGEALARIEQIERDIEMRGHA